MINIEYSRRVLLQSIPNIDFPLNIPESFSKVARQLDLEIVKMNFTMGRYFGLVLAKGDKSWLVRYNSKQAVILNFDEIPEGGVVPRLFDEVLIVLRHGVVEVSVEVADRNDHSDSKVSE